MPQRNLGTTEILVQVEDNLQRVAAPQIRQGGLGLLQAECRFRFAHNRGPLALAAGHGEQLLQNLVCGQGKAELRRGAQDPGGSALEEGAEAFFAVDGASAVPKRGVFGFAFAGFDLQPRLDHVTRGGKVGGGHSRNGACGQELQDADLFVGAFAKEIALQMVVSWEVDAGKGHVAQEAGASTFVQAD